MSSYSLKDHLNMCSLKDLKDLVRKFNLHNKIKLGQKKDALIGDLLKHFEAELTAEGMLKQEPVQFEMPKMDHSEKKPKKERVKKVEVEMEVKIVEKPVEVVVEVKKEESKIKKIKKVVEKMVKAGALTPDEKVVKKVSKKVSKNARKIKGGHIEFMDDDEVPKDHPYYYHIIPGVSDPRLDAIMHNWRERINAIMGDQRAIGEVDNKARNIHSAHPEIDLNESRRMAFKFYTNMIKREFLKDPRITNEQIISRMDY